MKKVLLTILTISLLSATSFTSYGSEKNDSSKEYDWYVSPLGGFIQNDDSRGTERTDDTGSQAYLGFGKELSDNFNLELGLGGTWLQGSENNTYLRQLGAELDAQYFFSRNSTFSPYISAGLGLLDSGELDETNPTWGAGLGVLTDIGLNNALLRTEVKYRSEVDSSDWTYDDFLLRAGVSIPFGSLQQTPSVNLTRDSDNDTVIDSEDKCPATASNVTVNSFGCEVINDSSSDIDSDSDDFPSTIDQCSNTPMNRLVNTEECPVNQDTDNDGILNPLDECPNSAQGARIDFKGCEIKAVIRLPKVNFATNSAILTNDSKVTLDGAVNTLNQYLDIIAEVAGHTDNTGSESMNLKLSSRRAAAVKLYLINHGIDASRLSARGYGESQPIADNATLEGRKANRRVDLNIK